MKPVRWRTSFESDFDCDLHSRSASLKVNSVFLFSFSSLWWLLFFCVGEEKRESPSTQKWMEENPDGNGLFVSQWEASTRNWRTDWRQQQQLITKSRILLRWLGKTSWRRSSDDDGSARGTSEQSTSFPPYSFNATDREKQWIVCSNLKRAV